MLTVEEALDRIEREVVPLTACRLPLSQAQGCRLAEAVAADRDSPPFDKSLVDGYALRAGDWPARQVSFRAPVAESIPAGRMPTMPLPPGQVALVMTGAPLPAGADAVVMREEAEARGNEVVLSPRLPIRPGMNAMQQGREARRGDVMVDVGTPLDAIALGSLATVGATQPLVWPRPRVAILSTGDELVAPDQVPGPGQIRNSNSVTLDALCRQLACPSTVLATARDEAASLSTQLAAGIEPQNHDVLLISGGVSAGDLDLVPAALEALGVRPSFHKVRIKPGKPLFFGVKARPSGGPPVLVFGLPGNPVSTIVDFLVFVRPALEKLSSAGFEKHVVRSGMLATGFSHRGDRPTYHPCLVRKGEGALLWAEPLPWAGSPDLRTAARADAFAIFPAGDRQYPPGAVVGLIPIPGRFARVVEG